MGAPGFDAKPKSAPQNAADQHRSEPAPSPQPVDEVLARRERARQGLVETQWWVDYSLIAGQSKKLPYRSGDDQLIVDELKIHPDGAPSSEHLAGGNMAKSGDVFLGSVALPATRGTVSAAVRYAARASFDVKLALDSMTKADRKAIADATAVAKQRAYELMGDRGDYAAIATELEAELSDRFPGKKLTVTLTPLGMRGGAPRSYAAKAADYDASTNTKFAVVIDPTERHDNGVSWTSSVSGEEGTTSSDQSGAKVGFDAGTHTTDTKTESTILEFQTRFTNQVEETFGFLEKDVLSNTDSKTTNVQKTVEWKLGIGPEKEKKDGDKPEPAKTPGILSRLRNHIESGTKWLLKQGSKLVHLSSAVLDLAGDIWDKVSDRASISRDSTSTDGTTDTKSHAGSDETTTQISSMKTIGTELASRFLSSSASELKQEITTHLATEISVAHKDDKNHKKVINRGSSGTSVTHEVDGLHVSVTPKG